MANLHADENFRQAVVEELRKLGHDILTAVDAGRANKGIKDPDVLAFAISQRRAVLTFNRRDFFRLHRQTPSHCGIIACTNDNDSAALANRIHQAILNCPILDNQLIRIIRPPIP
jgi:predicted nuclease of predicted toxin-antitoxin system